MEKDADTRYYNDYADNFDIFYEYSRIWFTVIYVNVDIRWP